MRYTHYYRVNVDSGYVMMVPFTAENVVRFGFIEDGGVSELVALQTVNNWNRIASQLTISRWRYYV